MFAAVVFVLSVCSAHATYWSHPGRTSLVLGPGSTMMPGDPPVSSPSGQFHVKLESQALLVYRQSTNDTANSTSSEAVTVFNTEADDLTVTNLELSSGGGLYLYGEIPSRTRAALWRSNSPLTWSGFYKPVLGIADDGYLMLSIDGVTYWESGGMRTLSCLDLADLSNKSAEIIRMGDTLVPSKKYHSPKGTFFLILQHDGNLCVYRVCDDTATWCTHTYRARPDKVTITATGELVFYGDMSRPPVNKIWFQGEASPRRYNSELRLADDGRMYLCKEEDCYWQSELRFPDVDK